MTLHRLAWRRRLLKLSGPRFWRAFAASFPPSYFANRGQPCCSRWGKSEIEWIALAYVQALANDGDAWKKLSREQTLNLLTEEQKRYVHCLLYDDYYQHWFDAVQSQIADSDGAFGVRGSWYRRDAK